MSDTVFSIGHGNRDEKLFFELLKKYQISYLIDVRTSPFSKFNPQFNRDNLKVRSREHNIVYVFMGDDLGGMPKDRSCYDKEGRIIYSEVMKKSFFNRSINRLITANTKKIRVACMCSETNPADCHRSKLIGEYLHNYDIEVTHIDKAGDLKTQNEVMNELTKGKNTQDIFGDSLEFKSKGVY